MHIIYGEALLAHSAGCVCLSCLSDLAGQMEIKTSNQTIFSFPSDKTINLSDSGNENCTVS